jgi:pilus assembly protein CpaC
MVVRGGNVMEISISRRRTMRGLLATLASLFLFAASNSDADEPRPVPAPRPVDQQGLRDSTSEKSDLSIEHLLKAAEHLEVAGLADEATKLRSIARQRAIHDSDLSRKEAELECLQEEVDRLRALTGQAPGVVIEFVALEVQRGKLGIKAQEFGKMIGLGPISPAVSAASGEESDEAQAANERSRSQNAAVVEANPARLPLFRELREKGIVRILAEPTLVATSRRPASFLAGGQVPIPVPQAGGTTSVDYKTFGTQIEVVASVLANQQLRLQTTFELSELNLKDSVIVEGATIPGITTRRISTEVEMRLGQTMTVGRLLVERQSGTAKPDTSSELNDTPWANVGNQSHAESVEMLLFITPRLAHGTIVPQASSVLPTAGADDSGVVLPAEGSFLGPTVPVLKRRPVRK